MLKSIVKNLLGSSVCLVFLTASFVQAQQSPELPNFHEVIAKKLYRGGQPSQAGFQMLAKSGIKTVVDLRKENPQQIQQEKQVVESLGMKFISVPMTASDTPNEQAMTYLENTALTDPSLQPVFVHCHFGQDRTGLVIGLHRVFRESPAMTPQQSYNEMLALGFHPKFKALADYYYAKTNWHPFWLRQLLHSL